MHKILGREKSSVLTILVVGVSAYASMATATEYELVRGSQYSLCKTLVANFNEFRNEAPLTCRVKVTPRFKELSLPKWENLDPSQNLTLIETVERARFGVDQKGEQGRQFVVKELKPMIASYLAKGELRIRRAHVAFAPGEPQTVIAYAFGCEKGSGFSEYTSHLAVLNSERTNIDPRFGPFQGGDIFLLNGKPYAFQSSEFPVAIGSGTQAPSKKHKGYVLIYESFRRPEGIGGTGKGGSGGFTGPKCQIGFDRLGRVQ